MNDLAVHLSVQHPRGAIAGLQGLELALALRDDLRRLGLAPTLARRRLRPGAVNFVVGAEYGFDADAARGHACVLVRGIGEARGLSPQARRLLGRFPVLESDPAALAYYREGREGEPPVAFWQPGPATDAPWTDPATRPLGLVVEGAPTERQAAVLAGLERLGLPVTRIAAPLAGPERAALLRQARAWLALLPADDAAPDLMAIRLAQRHGVAVLAECAGHAAMPRDDAHADIQWFEPVAQDVLRAVAADPMGAEWAQVATRQWRQRQAQPREAEIAALWQLGVQERERLREAGAAPARPDRLNTDLAGQGYRPGWFNLAPEDGDLDGRLGEGVDLGAGAWSVIELGELPLSAPATAATLDESLALLADGGRLVLRATGADVAHWREALAPWCDRFWERGLLTHHLVAEHIGHLDDDDLPVPPTQARRLRLVLVKTDTGLEARSRARIMRGDFALPH